MDKRLFFSLLLLLGSTHAFAQIGGNTVFALPELPSSARVAALGGYHVSVMDSDVSMAAENPALLNPDMDQHLAVSGSDFIADTKFGQVAYGRHFKGTGTFMGSIRYLNYGEFVKSDRLSNKLGKFSGGEFILQAAGAKHHGSFSMGYGLNILYSGLERYTALGVSMDLGITYRDTAKLVTTSLVANNLGTQIKPYTSGKREPMPLNIQLGFSKKFEHMPLRLTLLAHHLNIPDLTARNLRNRQTTSLETGQPVNNEASIGEKIFRHFIINGELVFSENFHLRIGYNHHIRQTMTIENKKGLVGYSGGLGIQISKFRISYGYGAYHLATATNHLTLSTNLSELFVKK